MAFIILKHFLKEWDLGHYDGCSNYPEDPFKKMSYVFIRFVSINYLISKSKGTWLEIWRLSGILKITVHFSGQQVRHVISLTEIEYEDFMKQNFLMSQAIFNWAVLMGNLINERMYKKISLILCKIYGIGRL